MTVSRMDRYEFLIDVVWGKFCDTECPTCGEYFKRVGTQQVHADKTGHVKVEFCHAIYSRTKKLCRREAGHPGSHAYRGAYDVITWEDKKS